MTDDKPIPKNEVEKELDKVPQDAELKKLSDKAAAEKLKKEIDKDKAALRKMITTDGWKIYSKELDRLYDEVDRLLAEIPAQPHFGTFMQGAKKAFTDLKKFVERNTKTDAKSKS